MCKFFLVIWLFSFNVVASASNLVNGDTLTPVTLAESLRDVTPGHIVIVSEIHDYAPHHDNQNAVLAQLGASWPHISVGLEFFEQRFQDFVDQYTSGILSESDFLKLISWPRNPFDFYRAQALFPSTHGGHTLALNASEILTKKVAKSGLESLSNTELNELPDHFSLGNADYFERFRQVMVDHIPPEKLDRYFEAQSLRDDTMAQTACQFIAEHPEQIVVIIVGDFHASYGGGLPDRLIARGCTQVTVFSQVIGDGLSNEDLLALIGPDKKWGRRGTYVWID